MGSKYVHLKSMVLSAAEKTCEHNAGSESEFKAVHLFLLVLQLKEKKRRAESDGFICSAP